MEANQRRRGWKRRRVPIFSESESDDSNENENDRGGEGDRVAGITTSNQGGGSNSSTQHNQHSSALQASTEATSNTTVASANQQEQGQESQQNGLLEDTDDDEEDSDIAKVLRSRSNVAQAEASRENVQDGGSVRLRPWSTQPPPTGMTHKFLSNWSLGDANRAHSDDPADTSEESSDWNPRSGWNVRDIWDFDGSSDEIEGESESDNESDCDSNSDKNQACVNTDSPELKEIKASVPLECVRRIMEYSDVRSVRVLANTSNAMRKFVSYELVIRSALLGLCPDARGADNDIISNEKARERMTQVMVGIEQISVIMPSPVRLLALLCGRKCEIPWCNRPTPSLLCFDAAICVCDQCQEYLTVPGSHFKFPNAAEAYRARIPRMDINNSIWRAPHVPHGSSERAGPIATLADLDKLLREEINVATLNRRMNLGARRRIKTVWDKTTQLVSACDADRTRIMRHNRERKHKVARDQIMEGLEADHAEAAWTQSVFRRDEFGRFAHPVISSQIEHLISRSRGTSTTQLVEFARNLVLSFAPILNEIAVVGLSNLSIFDSRSLGVVESILVARWKKQLKTNPLFVYDNIRHTDDQDDIMEDPFLAIAKFMFGSRCKEKAVRMALEEPTSTVSLRPYMDSSLHTYCLRSRQRCSTFSESCDIVYKRMVETYGM